MTDPVTGKVILKPGQHIDEKTSLAVENVGLEQLRVRSALTCESDRGCCVKCYGLNLATNELAQIGQAVGIIAAQSIGEPGTQLTMRTFHSGGVAFSSSKQPQVNSKVKGFLTFMDLRVVEDVDGNFVALNKNGKISIRDKDGLELESHKVVIGSIIKAADGAEVKKGQEIFAWDANSVPIIAEKAW